MTFSGRQWKAISLAIIAFVAGCNDDSTDPLTQGTSGVIVIGDTTVINDTTLLTGESINYGVDVAYPFSNHGKPLSVFWSLSDTSIVNLDVISDGSAFLTAKKSGTTFLIAFINKKFTDSTTVRVVPTGSIRWRVSLATTAVSGTAVDDSDRVFVSDGPSLVSFTPSGAQRWGTPGCFNFLTPSVRQDNGLVMTTGSNCTRRHSKAGVELWMAPVGSPDNGAALTADDGLVILSYVGTVGGAGAVIVSRFSGAGTEVWRDTLQAVPLAQKSTPAVASNGDIYVPWRSDTANQLSRLSATGALRWTVKTPAWARYTGPALDGVRIYVTYQGGISAFDTTGAVVWSAQVGVGGQTAVSSPIVDATGNVYLQSQAGVYSFTSAGATRWHADSLGQAIVDPVASPSLVAGGVLVVPCGGEVCAVQAADGSLAWRSSIGGGVGSTVTVGSDGTLFTTRATASELVALWSHAIPVLVGWPTEGHDMQRSRRQF